MNRAVFLLGYRIYHQKSIKMPKLVDLSKISSETNLPDFRVPKWLKPDQISLLMRGALSDTESEAESDDNEEDDSMVHIEEPDIGIVTRDVKDDKK